MKEIIIRITGTVIVSLMFYSMLELFHNTPNWASFSFGMIMATLILNK